MRARAAAAAAAVATPCCRAATLPAMLPAAHAMPHARPQVALAAAQEQLATAVESERDGRAGRLATLSRRAAVVCAPGPCGGGAPASVEEYESAFEAVLAYVLEATGLAGSGQSSSGSGCGAATAAGRLGSSSGGPAGKRTTGSGGAAAGSSAAAADRGTAAGGSAAAAAGAAALDSVFPLSAVARWVTLEPAERIAELAPLAKLTLGICLYNAAAPVGGDGGSGRGAFPRASGALAAAATGYRRTSGSGSGAGSRLGNARRVAGCGAAQGGEGLLASGAVARQLQRGAEVLRALAAAEEAAWAALARCKGGGGGGGIGAQAGASTRRPGGDGPAVLYAAAATELRAAVADAAQGLAACEALTAGVESELAAVRARLRVSGPAMRASLGSVGQTLLGQHH